jgi:hypothetical protein
VENRQTATTVAECAARGGKMPDLPTIWGIHMEWDDATVPPDKKDVAIGWHELGDLNAPFFARCI